MIRAELIAEKRRRWSQGMPIGSAVAGLWSWRTGGSGLKFAPAAMINPLVIDGSTVGSTRSFPRASDVTNGYAFTSPNHPQDPGRRYFKPDQDVIIINFAARDLFVYGGRNVRVIGPHVTATAHGQTLMMFEANFGQVFLEGAHLDAAGYSVDSLVTRWSAEAAQDGGASVSRFPLLIVQSSLFSDKNDHEAPSGLHVDGYQDQGTIDRLEFERVTIEGGQQGIYPRPDATPPANGLYLRKVNVRRWRNADGSSYTRAYVFSLPNGLAFPTTPNFPIVCDDVWAERNLPPFSAIGRSVMPVDEPGVSWDGTEAIDEIGSYCDFSASALDVTGIIRIGVPPGGDFVTAAEVGQNYVSPWGMP